MSTPRGICKSSQFSSSILFPLTHIKCSMKISRLRRRRKRTASSRLPRSRRTTTNRTLSPHGPRHRTGRNRHDEIKAIDQLIKAQIRPPGQRRELHKTNTNKIATRAEQKTYDNRTTKKRGIGKINFRDKSGNKIIKSVVSYTYEMSAASGRTGELRRVSGW